MPRLVRLAHDARAEAAIEAFGNQVRVAILGYLMEHGAHTRGEIADALGIAPPTTNNHLRSLVEAGLLRATPVQALRGSRPRYEVEPERVVELYQALGAALRLPPTAPQK